LGNFRKKNGFFLKNKCYDPNFAKSSSILNKKPPFLSPNFSPNLIKNHNIGPCSSPISEVDPFSGKVLPLDAEVRPSGWISLSRGAELSSSLAKLLGTSATTTCMFCTAVQGCQIFLDTKYQKTGENIPNCH
jgi:hypothetical protein